MRIPYNADRPLSGGARPSGDPPDAPPEERALPCAECGLLYPRAEMLDFCDSCGAPRCRSCAQRASDDVGGLYICSNCADALDTL